MESVLRAAVRTFCSKEHLRNVLEGEWVSLFDEEGRVLQGIRGRMGASSVTAEGVEIGVDLIEMAPGSAFPLHVHAGDHILYVLEGRGRVHIDGADRVVRSGDTIFIAAEHAHGVKTFDDETTVLRFLAFGHPHKALTASDRMRLVPPSPFLHSPGDESSRLRSGPGDDAGLRRDHGGET